MEIINQINECIERCNGNFDAAQSHSEKQYWDGCINAYLNVIQIMETAKKIDEEFEPDEDYKEESQCNTCGLTDDHSIDCPNNNSPFAELIRNGHD